MNADDRLSLDPLGRVEGGDRIVEGGHVADVCPQPSIPDPLDELTQFGAIGYDDEVDSQAARVPRLGRARNPQRVLIRRPRGTRMANAIDTTCLRMRSSAQQTR